MKIGIIGTGSIASSGHGPAIMLLENAELTAVLSRDKQRGVKFLDDLVATGSVALSLDDFLKKDFALAIVASPDGLHYEQAKSCLIAGKHVLIEKPMTLEVSEAEELESLAVRNGLTLAIGFHMRSHSGHIALKQKIDSGVIGDIKHIRVIWAWPVADDSNWRANDELTKWWSLSAVGSHCIDLARWFGNDTDVWPKLSSVLASPTFKGVHDETAIVSGQLSSGVTVEVTSSVLFGPYSRIEVLGSKGTAICDSTLGRDGAGKITINNEQVGFAVNNPFAEQLRNIMMHITGDAPLNAPSSAGVRSVIDLNKVLEK